MPSEVDKILLQEKVNVIVCPLQQLTSEGTERFHIAPGTHRQQNYFHLRWHGCVGCDVDEFDEGEDLWQTTLNPKEYFRPGPTSDLRFQLTSSQNVPLKNPTLCIERRHKI